MRTHWDFSLSPLTLGDRLDAGRLRMNDFEALARLLQRRAVPPASETEVRELTEPELLEAMAALAESFHIIRGMATSPKVIQ
jgi:hypothetical protein